MADVLEPLIGRREALRRGVLFVAGAMAAPGIGALAACTPAGPRPIAYGRDECAYCRMVVSDPRFGAALVTSIGRTIVFDSVECLASWYTLSRGDGGREVARTLWVSDFNHPGTLLEASRARYLRVPGPASPMGKGLLAIASNGDARLVPGGGETFGWAEVVAIVRREGLQRGVASAIVPLVREERNAPRD